MRGKGPTTYDVRSGRGGTPKAVESAKLHEFDSDKGGKESINRTFSQTSYANGSLGATELLQLVFVRR